jgi:hypothetical protein
MAGSLIPTNVSENGCVGPNASQSSGNYFGTTKFIVTYADLGRTALCRSRQSASPHFGDETGEKGGQSVTKLCRILAPFQG